MSLVAESASLACEMTSCFRGCSGPRLLLKHAMSALEFDDGCMDECLAICKIVASLGRTHRKTRRSHLPASNLKTQHGERHKVEREALRMANSCSSRDWKDVSAGRTAPSSRVKSKPLSALRKKSARRRQPPGSMLCWLGGA